MSSIDTDAKEGDKASQGTVAENEPPTKRVKFALEPGFKIFFDTLDWTDLTIVIDNIQIKVHRYIVSRKSEYFKKACTGDFKEKHDGIIKLEDVDLVAVQAMLFFLYDKRYEMAHDTPNDDLLFHVRVYAVADYYDIPDLSSAVYTLFHDLVAELWNDDQLPQAIREVYSLPRVRDDFTLRTRNVEICKEHILAFWDKQPFQDMLRDVRELHHELANYSIGKLKALSPACPSSVVVRNQPIEYQRHCHGCDAHIAEDWWDKHKFMSRKGGQAVYCLTCPSHCGTRIEETDRSAVKKVLYKVSHP